MSTPESMAEIGAGADGWASGSQAWNGTIAAFSPSPMMKNAAATWSAGLDAKVGIAARMWAMLRVPVRL